MKLLLSFFVFISFTINAQESTCNSGKENAIKDYSSGEIRLYDFDRAVQGKYGMTFRYILEKEYNFFMEYGGDYYDEELACYNSKMYELITNKFGNNFLDSIRKVAQIMDENGNGNRDAIWPKEIKSFREFIYCNLNLENALSYPEQEIQFSISFVVDINGNLIDFESNEPLESKHVKEIYRILQLTGSWTYETYNGKYSDERVSLPIIFSKKMKEQNCP